MRTQDEQLGEFDMEFDQAGEASQPVRQMENMDGLMDFKADVQMADDELLSDLQVGDNLLEDINDADYN